MGDPYTYVQAFATAPFSAGNSYVLLDYSDLTQETLPDQTYVGTVYFQAGSFSSNATISIGWVGNTDGVVPASAGITLNNLGTTGASYNLTGNIPAISGSTPLVLTSDSDVDSGTVYIGIRYITWSTLP